MIAPAGSPYAAPLNGQLHDQSAHEMGWTDYFRVMRRRWGIVLAIVALTMGIVVLTVRMQEPEYRAGATIRLGAPSAGAGIIGGSGLAATGAGIAGLGGGDLLTQLNIILSRSVSEEVVDAAGLRLRILSEGVPYRILSDVSVDAQAPDGVYRLQFGDEGVRVVSEGIEASAPYGSVVDLAGVRFAVRERPEVDSATVALVPRSQAVGEMRQRLAANLRERTSIVDLEFTAEDPNLAQDVVNAVAQVYKDRTARVARRDIEASRIFLEEQIGATDDLLIAAQNALSDFRRRETVFSSRERFAAEQAGIMAVEMRREELAADRSMFQQLLQGLREPDAAARSEMRTILSAPQIVENRLVTQLSQELLTHELMRDTLTAGPWATAMTNPDVRRLDAIIASTEARLATAVGSHIDGLDARIAALDNLRERTAEQMRAMPEPEAEEMRLLTQVEIMRGMAEELRSEYQRIRISEAMENGTVEIVDLSELPGAVPDRMPLKLLFGLLVGLLLGGAASVVVENSNTSIRRKDDVERVLGLPELAIVPQFGRPAHSNGKPDRAWLPVPIFNGARNGRVGPSGRQELIASTDPHSPAAEAYRSLRTNLIFSQTIRDLRRLVITSSAPSEGKSTTAANLAVTFAQQGIRVLLVDCDLRKARLHKVFGVPREPGLSQLVLGLMTADEVIRPSGVVDDLFILTGGTLPPNPAEILGGPRMRQTLDALSDRFDLVILDTPPLLAASDAAIVGKMADGVLLVVRAGTTERAAAYQAAQRLHAVGARILGAVLNDPDSKVAQYGGYYAYEYYGVKD